MLHKIASATLKRPLTILFIIWLILQAILLISSGIVTTQEALKYSYSSAFLLKQGSFPDLKDVFYATYIFLHIIFIKLGFETAGVYVVQLLANLFAMYLLYKGTIQLTGNKSTAFLCVLLLLICLPWLSWTVYLYTESLFGSLVIIFTALLFSQDKNNRRILALLVVLLLLTFARPNGLLFTPVMYCVAMYYLLAKRKWITASVITIGIVAGFIFLLNYAMKSSKSYDFIKPLVENNVRCYISEEPFVSNAYLQHLDNSMTGVFSFVLHYPGQFMKIASLRFLSYWGMNRPHYSSSHNIYLMCFFYPLYLFAIIGIGKLRKAQPVFVVYAIAVLLFFSLTVMLTCDDWGNRFNMPVIPFVMLFASVGISHVYSLYRLKK